MASPAALRRELCAAQRRRREARRALAAAQEALRAALLREQGIEAALEEALRREDHPLPPRDDARGHDARGDEDDARGDDARGHGARDGGNDIHVRDHAETMNADDVDAKNPDEDDNLVDNDDDGDGDVARDDGGKSGDIDQNGDYIMDTRNSGDDGIDQRDDNIMDANVDVKNQGGDGQEQEQEQGQEQEQEQEDSEAAQRERWEKRKAETARCLEEQKKAVDEGAAPARDHMVGFLADDDPRTSLSRRIALASYPRSGNSLLRSIVERMTNVYTGSDCDPLRPLNSQLVEAGMMGEGFVKDVVFAVKTHFPERLGRCALSASRAVLIVRNPFDAIVSYFNMVLTQTHTHTIRDDEFIKYADIWDAFVREEISIWKQFHAHWLDDQVSKSVPVLLVRYEDVIYNREAAMRRIATFLHEHDPLDVDELEEVVRTACAASREKLGVYVPRDSQDAADASTTDTDNPAAGAGKLDSKETKNDDAAEASGEDADSAWTWASLPPSALRNLRFFDDHQQAYIFTVAKSELVRFGYWDSFFESTHGPGAEDRKMNSCIVVKKASRKRPGFMNCQHYLLLNQRYALRPLTVDDPFGRGFGKRWQAALDKLPPVRIKAKGDDAAVEDEDQGNDEEQHAESGQLIA